MMEMREESRKWLEKYEKSSKIVENSRERRN